MKQKEENGGLIVTWNRNLRERYLREDPWRQGRPREEKGQISSLFFTIKVFSYLETREKYERLAYLCVSFFYQPAREFFFFGKNSFSHHSYFRIFIFMFFIINFEFYN